MLQKRPKDIKWECSHSCGSLWHGSLGWSHRTQWHGDPAGQSESRLLSVLFFSCIDFSRSKAPASTTAGIQSPPEMLVLTHSSSQTPMAEVTATTITTCTVTAQQLVLPPAPWEAWCKGWARFYRRRLPWPCSRLCGTHQVGFKRPPKSGACRRYSASSSSSLSLLRGQDIRRDRLWKVQSLPALFSMVPSPFLPHGQEKNSPCFISLVPLVCVATVSWRPDTFHLALFLKIILQLAFFFYIFIL